MRLRLKSYICLHDSFLGLKIVKNIFLGLKKGLSRLSRKVAPKHTAQVTNQNPIMYKKPKTFFKFSLRF